ALLHPHFENLVVVIVHWPAICSAKDKLENIQPMNLLPLGVFSRPSSLQRVTLYRFADPTGLTSRLSRAPFYKRWWVLLRKRLSFSYKSRVLLQFRIN
ncbi:MAG: hypothetical protein ACE5K4_12520, partial [Candidatus Hydrothermarchaeota archaeon]